MVETVSKNIFMNCENLETVSFHKVKTIEKYAFLHCSSLDCVSFPKVETIEYGAFMNCYRLSTFLGNPNIGSIGDNAFTESQEQHDSDNTSTTYYSPISFNVEKIGFKEVKKRGKFKYEKI